MNLEHCDSSQKKKCVEWIEKYLKDCICNSGDATSFGFGILSLLCWGAAEVPQIFTNFRNKSAHGVSLLFLLTWIVGDVFNLVGCLLEPSTLPTQYYTALLYTISTVILVLQGIYYDYIYQRWKCNKTFHLLQDTNHLDSKTQKLLDPSIHTIYIPKPSIEVPQRREFHYRSARSLAGSQDKSSHISYTRVVNSDPSSLDFNSNSSSSDDDTDHSKKLITEPIAISNSVGRVGAFLVTCLILPGKCMMATLSFEDHGETFGQWLGWLMASIYMGGRIPQIWLNMKRESVEGLNPLMFIFALIANIAYVASILLRNSRLEKIRANMPWLLDAIVCVALDLLIIIQHIYYKNVMKRKSPSISEFMKSHEEKR